MADKTASLAAKYEDRAYLTQIALEMAVLEDSFTLVTRYKDEIESFDALAELYRDAKTVAVANDLSTEEKRQTLYRIYDGYFGYLAATRYRLRAKLKAHKHMYRLRRVVKRGHAGATSTAFWREFALKCGISFLVFFGAEIWLLWATDETTPLALVAVLWLAFAGGALVYFYYALALEGRRIYADLQKWLGFKTNPAEFNRPTDIWQYAKLAAPLAISVLGALAKIYIQ